MNMLTKSTFSRDILANDEPVIFTDLLPKWNIANRYMTSTKIAYNPKSIKLRFSYHSASLVNSNHNKVVYSSQ